MHRSKGLPTLLVVAMFCAQSTGATTLQWLGEFHGDDTIARDGEHWLALRRQDGRAWLEDTEIRVEPVHDPILDEVDERTGRRVSTPAMPLEPLALLRGDRFAAGPLTADEREDVVLRPNDPFAIHAGTLPGFQIVLDCEDAAGPPASEFRCRVIAFDTDRDQVLHVFAASRTQDGALMLGDEGSAALRFAGDLDRDGHIDLILDLRDHYNVQRTEVWLSGSREPDALLHRASHATVTGC